MQQIIDVDEELHRQAAIEPEVVAHLFDRRGIGHRPGEIGGRIAGQRPRQQEGDDDDTDQRRHGVQDAPPDESQLPGLALHLTSA